MVKVVLTGFGDFPGVANNPTNVLIKDIQRLRSSDRLVLPDGAELLDVTSLRVAAQDVRRWLGETTSCLCDIDDKVLMVHLGTDATSDCFKLESTAYNNATFRVPDVDGWQPNRQLIVDGPGATLDDPLKTDLDLGSVQGRLHEARYNVRLSTDPGRYVCNWTYFVSLLDCRAAGCGRWHSLFVHVPPFSCIDREVQLEFVVALLTLLCQQVGAHAAQRPALASMA